MRTDSVQKEYELISKLLIFVDINNLNLNLFLAFLQCIEIQSGVSLHSSRIAITRVLII
jgi:hypothetical protein